MKFMSNAFSGIQKDVRVGLQANQEAIHENREKLEPFQQEFCASQNSTNGDPATPEVTPGSGGMRDKRKAAQTKRSKIPEDPYVGEPECITFMVSL